MEESEKTAALKKAYAEIILNTAKEAAARIVVSERKKASFERDLNSTRDEALRMLVHLKQMIDSKTKEAEVISLTQKRKIDELEGQLYEAEDVITDLRSELKWVRDKLEKVKKNQLQPLNGHITKEDIYSHKNVTVEPILPSILSSGLETMTTSDTQNMSVNQRILDNRCCSTTQQTENSSVAHVENSDLASITIRSKESDLYRNGFTQRILALERNLPDRKLPPLGDVEGQHSLIKNELTIKTNSKDVTECTVPSSKTNSMGITKNFSAEEMKKPVNFRTLRRRKTRFGKTKAALCWARTAHLKSHHLSSVLSRCKINSVDGNVRSEVTAGTLSSLKTGIIDAKNASSLDEKLQAKHIFSTEDANVIIHNEKRNATVQSDAVVTALISSSDQILRPHPPSSIVNSRMIYSFAIRGNVKFAEDRLKIAENEAKVKPLPRLDPGLTLIRRGVGPISGSSNVTVSVKALNKSGLVSNVADKVTELEDKSVLAKPEGDAVQNSTGACSELSSQIDNALPVHSDSKDVNFSVETNESPSKSDCNRLIKYTFQRKRKKGSLSLSDGNTSPDNSNIKRRAAEKQRDDAAKPQKSSLINVSPRDNRRLAQVARQLISLSGKRW
ncbi:hypothetical protein Ddye_015096 [Dipteronia dyeriana]|uniref:Uncharacterized protein n=1 Tax=Dipteronia dyeriana TaxID=168575 RepID=A0AAD9U4M4_9ROSI|nr:hypothetical protein Ddye_015096 [Dipteronia dyeriana]